MFQVPEYIRSLVPYVPGKPIEETKREFQLERVIKLASNENPLGPSPLAMKAVQTGISELYRYPDASGYHLKKALSKHLGVPASALTLGNGSNEIIDTLIRTFCQPGDQIVVPRYSFIAYKISAQIHGVQTLEVPTDEEFRCDPAALLKQVEENPHVKMILVSNPNNPTGSYWNLHQLQEVIQGLKSIRRGSVIFVLDSAYGEYVPKTHELLSLEEESFDIPNPLSLLQTYPGLIVLKTFSKVYGLAGLRVGYGIAQDELISYVEKVRQPFNVNFLALKGAEAALSDVEFVKKSVEFNRMGMQFWKQGLSQLGISCRSTAANFIIVDVRSGIGLSGPEVFQACLMRGVVFRPLANYGLFDYLRITIGTQDENEVALQALAAVQFQQRPSVSSA